MKYFKIILITLSVNLFSGLISAQDSTSHVSGITKTLNAGFGVSSWGIPIYANVEFPLNGMEAITMSIGGSYQSKKETFGYFLGNYSWRHSIVGLQVAGNYYFDELLEIPESFDMYGGLQLEYYIWNTKLTDNGGLGLDENYNGSGSGGLGLSGFVGGRYHFDSTDKLSINLLLGAGTVFSSGRIGISLKI